MVRKTAQTVASSSKMITESKKAEKGAISVDLLVLEAIEVG